MLNNKPKHVKFFIALLIAKKNILAWKSYIESYKSELFLNS